MDHPWSSAGIETTARAWSWRACAVAALWCGLYVVVLLPALVVYTVVCTFLDAVAAVVSRTPAPAPLRSDGDGTCVRQVGFRRRQRRAAFGFWAALLHAKGASKPR